ncbi:MAG: recombination mediator RecR [Acidimicrobiia bacterium]
MAGAYAPVVQSLIDELGRLPGIGPKSAQRIAFHLLKQPAADVERLSRSIVEAKERVRFCARCFNVSEAELCGICLDSRRDQTVLCVVEEARDVVAIEKTGEFRGRYHVLLGAISPIDGIGPEQLKIRELLTQLGSGEITEVIICTNPNIEGEATALYLARLLKPLGIVVSRIASGLPVGGDLEYADELTLGRALEGRRTIDA